jgi:hypothetical protein
MKFFRRTVRYTLLDHKRHEKILEDVRVEIVDEKLNKLQIKFAKICNKNKQQQDAKINAEL